MSNYNISGAIRLGPLSAAPSVAVEGVLYFNTSDKKTYFHNGTGWVEVASAGAIAASTGAALVGFDPAGLDHITGTNVQQALEDLDAAISDAGGSVFDDLSFAIQNEADTSKQLKFNASAITTATTRTISMPDHNVDLADILANTTSSYNIYTLAGVDKDDINLGVFSGAVIMDDSSIKSALQQLETYAEGLVVDSTAGSESDKAPSVSAVKNYVDGAIAALPDPITYQGVWNASTNTPELDNADTDVTGFLYRVTVAGTVDFGAGNISFSVGDSVVNNGTIWEKWDHSDQVDSVNGQTGAVSLGVSDLDDVNATSPTEGQVLTWDDINNEWIAATPAPGYSDEEAQDAVGGILDDGSNGDIDFTYDDATPRITGDIKNGSVVSEKLGAGLTLQGEVFRADNLLGGNAISEGYVNSISLFGLSTNANVPGMAFDATGHEGIEVTYKIKETTTNAVRIGTIRVASNATDAVLVDTFAETASMPISFNVIQVGDIAQVRYTNSGSNDMVMRADIKRIM